MSGFLNNNGPLAEQEEMVRASWYVRLRVSKVKTGLG